MCKKKIKTIRICPNLSYCGITIAVYEGEEIIINDETYFKCCGCGEIMHSDKFLPCY